MKLNLSKTLFVSAVALLSFNQAAEAHSVTTQLKSTSGASATDYYQVTCSPVVAGAAPTHHLYFEVLDQSNDNSYVGVSGFGAGGLTNAKAYTVFDTTTSATNNTVPSPGKTIQGGDTTYVLAVFHTGGASLQSYKLTAHCYQADNVTENTITGLGSATDALNNQ